MSRVRRNVSSLFLVKQRQRNGMKATLYTHDYYSTSRDDNDDESLSSCCQFRDHRDPRSRSRIADESEKERERVERKKEEKKHRPARSANDRFSDSWERFCSRRSLCRIDVSRRAAFYDSFPPLSNLHGRWTIIAMTGVFSSSLETEEERTRERERILNVSRRIRNNRFICEL